MAALALLEDVARGSLLSEFSVYTWLETSGSNSIQRSSSLSTRPACRGTAALCPTKTGLRRSCCPVLHQDRPVEELLACALPRPVCKGAAAPPRPDPSGLTSLSSSTLGFSCIEYRANNGPVRWQQ
ncbi:unnamed protein product [Arctogadus glacialis]